MLPQPTVRVMVCSGVVRGGAWTHSVNKVLSVKMCRRIDTHSLDHTGWRGGLKNGREARVHDPSFGTVFTAPSPPVAGSRVCLSSVVLRYVSLAAAVEWGALRVQLQVIGRSEGEQLCRTRLHAAECHTFFAFKKLEEEQNGHFEWAVLEICYEERHTAGSILCSAEESKP